MFVLDLRYYVLLVIQLLVFAVGVWAVVHAVRQRPDAFTAVDKLTKAKWLAILAVSALVILFLGFNGSGFLLSLIASVAVFVYQADVRPKIDEVQRGSRW
ncbi:DUF2516 family protein [Rhodococcus antarcticus]|uniref:DUF2516 family protein n=1 Tax=Rhodococcus antarcticus TaxID=2987751 RepID=UPI003F498201